MHEFPMLLHTFQVRAYVLTLDTIGGRILQARDAAENLNFTSITLNSNDPNVPSVIDIDALVDILIGSDDD